MSSSKSALGAAQEAESSTRAALSESGAALWEVKNMGSTAARLQQKVDLEKRKQQIAERYKAKLMKERIRAQVMLNDAKRGQLMAEASLGAAKDEDKSAQVAVKDARGVAKEGMKHSKQLALAAATVQIRVLTPTLSC